MAGAYRGEAKTDARDAYVIAETCRHRRDLDAITVPAQLAADLALLTSHRTDLVADRVRMVNRLRDILSGIFPALEHAFDYSSQRGALVLLTGWLAKRRVRTAPRVAATALHAANAQHTSVPGQGVAAGIVADLATHLLATDERITKIDAQITEVFRAHPQSQVIESMPGIGPILGAEFVVAAGELAAYRDEGHLASAAGLVPVPRDSGRRTGNLHSPGVTTASCGACSISPRRPASSGTDPTAISISRNAPKDTSKPSSPWPADASASCGH